MQIDYGVKNLFDVVDDFDTAMLVTHIRFLFVRPALCHPVSFRLAVARETLAFG
jgi:hypothetical protein